eukprot:gene12225-13368_t
MALFGTILSLSNDSGTIVFVTVMIFLTFFEAGLHYLEKVGGKLGYKALIMKLYREFMILGFISFALQILSTVTQLPENDKWYTAFLFAHTVILFVGIAFLIQSFLLITLISQRNKRLLYYDSCTSESLFFEYVQLHESKNDILKYLFNYGPISIPIPELREKIEFKIIQEYFIRSYKLDAKFKFANYMCKVLKNYIMSLMDVRPVNWFRVAFLVALNYLRILIFDPLFESDICERNPYEHVGNRSKNYGHHVCPEYQLRIVFIGIVAMTVYQGIVFISSEVYMQRLICKVLDDEETLQWLDTEEAHAIEENRRTTASAFPHMTELLNPNETPFRNNIDPAEKTAAPEFPVDLPPIAPIVRGKGPRSGSASEAINIEENATKQFQRSSIRRSVSYKSPLNDKDPVKIVELLTPVQETPIAAPPNRNLRERRNSITIQVPFHRDYVQVEGSCGSLVSMEHNTKALTTDVNTYNRRHLYLKCLERIIHVEYSYHENEARRTSVSSESEAYGLAQHHHSTHNVTGSGANVTESPPIGEGEALERINQLKALNMKKLRELMIQSKTTSPEVFNDNCTGFSNPNHVSPLSGHHSRQNSSGNGGEKTAFNFLNVLPSSERHIKLPSLDSNPGRELTPPITTEEVLNKELIRETIPVPTNRAIKRDFTTKFFEFQSEDESKEQQHRYSRLNYYSDDPNATNFQRAWVFSLDCFFYLISKLWGLVKAVFFILLYGRVSHDVQHRNETQHESALDDIKQLEDDLKGIFAWKNPDLYYTSVEFSLLLQCMYVALWTTNFVMLASESRYVVLWELALSIPMFLNFAMMKHIVFISCQLRSIIKIDKTVANKISEAAIEERSVKERLRRMIRDQLKILASDKRQWKNVLYSHYSQVMDENEEITQKEWKEFLYSLTLQLTNNSIRQLFKVIDQDQDGFIHWNDLYMIIFPDLIEKKVKISKKGKRHSHHRSKSSPSNEHTDHTHQFSVEYQISEENRLSYKKSTTTTTSILASSMKMIRSSLMVSTTKASGNPLSGSSPSTPSPQPEQKEIVPIAEREYKDSRESSTQSKSRSNFKNAGSDEPLQLDETFASPTNDCATDQLNYSQNSAAKAVNQPREASVDFDEERIGTVLVSRSTSPHPPLSKSASDHSLTAHTGYAKSKLQTDDESLEEMRELSRLVARQRNLSYRPPVPSSARSIGVSMFSAVKSTLGNISKGPDDDVEDEDDVDDEDEDEDDDIRNLPNPSQALPYHRFHSARSRINDNDDSMEEDDVEESSDCYDI